MNGRTVCATVFGALAAVTLVAGCSDHDGTGTVPTKIVNNRFDTVVDEQFPQVHADTARQTAHNVCSDLANSTDDPTNLDPFEVYRIAQKVEVKTGLHQDDSSRFVALSIEAFCPEYKAGFGK